MKRLLFLLLMFGLVFSLAACSEDEVPEETEQEERIVTVETAQVTKEDFVLVRSIFGRTTPNQLTPVTIQFPGEITELHASSGDVVEEGEDIAALSTAQGTITITSPGDGELTGLQAAEGEMVSNEEPLAMIADTETMVLEFSVTATIQKLFSKDDTYTAIIDDDEYEATITQVDTLPDDTGLYPVKATVENPDSDILAGMVVSIEVPERVIEGAIIVPTAAVNHDGDETFVYVIQDERAEKRAITVQETSSETAAVEGDIEKGEQVVISGQLTLSDGDQVDVVKGD